MTQDRVPLRKLTRVVLQAAGWGGRLSILQLWQRWEPIAMWLWRVRPVQAGSILRFGVSAYRGPTTVLADGTLVPKGARILHLHLDNSRVVEVVESASGNLWALAPRVSADLDALAEHVSAGHLGQVTALRGVTVLARIAGRFGFEVRPLPHNLRWALIHSLGGLVLASYHRGGRMELDRGLAWPGEIWMSAGALRRRLAGQEPDTRRLEKSARGAGAGDP